MPFHLIAISEAICYNDESLSLGEMSMPPTIWTFLIVCPLVFLAGFVDSVAGGGGVISLPAYLLAGIPVKMAAGTNKFANGFGTAVASYKYAKSGNIAWNCAIPAAVFSLVGASLGTSLAVYLREDVLQIIVLVALPLVSVVLFFARDFGQAAKEEKGKTQTLLLASLIGLLVGAYDGLVGPGTGTFLTLGFSLCLGYTLLKSAGCARIANLASNVASMVIYFRSGNIVFLVGIPAMACSIAGNYLGAKFATEGGNSRIRYVMFLVLGLLFLKIALNFFGIIDF